MSNQRLSDLLERFELGEELTTGERIFLSKILRTSIEGIGIAMTVNDFIRQGAGKHKEATGAYGLAGSIHDIPPSTAADHYKKYRHLLP